MSRSDQVKQYKPITRNSAGLRDAIFDEIDALRMGNSNPTRANAISKAASVIVETVHMEMEVRKHLSAVATDVTKGQEHIVHSGGGLGMPIVLGNPL